MPWGEMTRRTPQVASTEPTTGRRQLLVAAGLCVLGAGTVGAVGAVRAVGSGPAPRHPQTTSPASRHAVDRRAVSRVHTSSPIVALTFDDGPDPDFTPSVLDILGQHDARATFFVIGRNAGRHPALISRMLREGHVVANHSQDHRWLNELDTGAVRGEVLKAKATLGSVGAPENPLFRPPRGWTSPIVADVVNRAGLRSVFWSDCVEARLRQGVRPAAEALVAQAGPGSIILCHDGGALDGPNPQLIDRSRTVEALPLILEGLRRRGLRCVALADLLSAGRPV
jgi:peptidoglycan-N-acetylglucosamine deacetylase